LADARDGRRRYADIQRIGPGSLNDRRPVTPISEQRDGLPRLHRRGLIEAYTARQKSFQSRSTERSSAALMPGRGFQTPAAGVACGLSINPTARAMSALVRMAAMARDIDRSTVVAGGRDGDRYRYASEGAVGAAIAIDTWIRRWAQSHTHFNLSVAYGGRLAPVGKRSGCQPVGHQFESWCWCTREVRRRPWPTAARGGRQRSCGIVLGHCRRAPTCA
jgi:hypothetical protein